MRKSVAAVLSFLMIATPAFADVMGSRRSARAEKDRAVVVKKLESLGVHPEEAKREAAEMSSRDLEFFASSPKRLVMAGAQEGGGQGEFFSGSAEVHWYEWAIGAGVLVGTVLGIVVAVNNNE